MMDLEDFCVAIHKLNLSQIELAAAILWYRDKVEPQDRPSAGGIAKTLKDNGVLANPHSTRLGEGLVKEGYALKAGNFLRMNPTAREKVVQFLDPIFQAVAPEVDHQQGYLPAPVWEEIEAHDLKLIIKQINGCYLFEFYCAAAVLLRRLFEILLIESFEHEKVENLILDNEGRYKTLNAIINITDGKEKVRFGGEDLKLLKTIKNLGNRSAHKAQYATYRTDLSKIEDDVRVLFEKLLYKAGRK